MIKNPSAACSPDHNSMIYVVLMCVFVLFADKFWFWRLAPNHKALHYGDCNETDHPKLESLGSKRKSSLFFFFSVFFLVVVYLLKKKIGGFV
jgi:hypothetical protein